MRCVQQGTEGVGNEERRRTWWEVTLLSSDLEPHPVVSASDQLAVGSSSSTEITRTAPTSLTKRRDQYVSTGRKVTQGLDPFLDPRADLWTEPQGRRAEGEGRQGVGTDGWALLWLAIHHLGLRERGQVELAPADLVQLLGISRRTAYRLADRMRAAGLADDSRTDRLVFVSAFLDPTLHPGLDTNRAERRQARYLQEIGDFHDEDVSKQNIRRRYYVRDRMAEGLSRENALLAYERDQAELHRLGEQSALVMAPYLAQLKEAREASESVETQELAESPAESTLPEPTSPASVALDSSLPLLGGLAG